MVCFHPILTWTKRDNLASKKYYPLSLNCLARCRAEFWLENTPIIYALDIVRPEQVANERLKAKIAREGVTIYPENAES
jgi:hypothetical protein